MHVNTAIKLREKHDIGYAFVGQCVKMLTESVLAFDSMQHESSKIVLLDEKSEDGDSFISICRMDKTVHSIEVNEITSIYDNRNFKKFLIKLMRLINVSIKTKRQSNKSNLRGSNCQEE